MPTSTLVALPSADRQVERIVGLGLHRVAGLSEDDVRGAVDAASPGGALLVIHPSRLSAMRLTPLLKRAGKPGFVVTDMQDVDNFAPIDSIELKWTRDSGQCGRWRVASIMAGEAEGATDHGSTS